MLAGVCSHMYISVNRCQTSLQKTIGAPMQAHEAATMQASLTVTTERLHAFEEKINSRLDALTVVGRTLMLSAEKRHRVVLHAASTNPEPAIAIAPRTVFPRPNPAEPNPRVARATPPTPRIRATPYQPCAQRHLGEDTRRLPMPVHQLLFRLTVTTRRAFLRYAIGERRATCGGKEEKED